MKKTYLIGNNFINEYDENVDIINAVMNRRGFFLIHIPNNFVYYFANDLFRRKMVNSFSVRMRECGTTRRCVKIIPTNLVDYQKTIDLLDYLEQNFIKIKWKEGNHGYEINKIGKIIRKWQLCKKNDIKG